MLNRRSAVVSLLLVCALGVVSPLQAGTNVSLDTVAGEITLDLYDAIAPVEVANFLAYVNSGAYDTSFFHRCEPGFVLQGGGFTVVGNTIFEVPTLAPIPDNYGVANVRGTLAMAKTGAPDSATSQFFVNLGDNTTMLGPTGSDASGVGYMVFGEVTVGMDVIDAIAAWPLYDLGLGPVFTTVPSDQYVPVNWTTADLAIVTQATVIPEPMTMAMLGLGGACLLRRRRQRQKEPSTPEDDPKTNQ